MLKREDYKKAICSLELGLEQLEPNKSNCAICGDTDHQAWECHHNPISKNYLSREHWRCFHCNQVFYDPKEAELHFGQTDKSTPACKSKLAYLQRWAEQIKESERLNRPNKNIHKRGILATWRQVINKVEDLLMTEKR